MAFLRNRTINLINLHYGFQALAMGTGGVFYFVFLLRSGFSLSLTLATLAFILIGRFIMRPIVLVFAKRWGLKPALIVGTLILSLQYPMLAEVSGIGWTFTTLVLISALGDTFYWSSYHALFASLGDAEHRGHQVSAREALAAIIGIVAPLIGSWSIVHLGPHIAFAGVGVVQAMGIFPLLGIPNVTVKASAPGVFRSAIPGILLFFADGWFAASFVVAWQVALFLTLGENFQVYGGAMALSALVGAVSGMLLGRFIDAGNGRRAVLIAYGTSASILAVRAVSLHTPWLAIAANALGSLAACLQVPAMMTIVYNYAKLSPCTLRFHIATEGGWDAGGATACLLLAVLAEYGVSLSWLLAFGFLGIAMSVTLLRRYYGENDIAMITPPVPEIPPSMTPL